MKRPRAPCTNNDTAQKCALGLKSVAWEDFLEAKSLLRRGRVKNLACSVNDFSIANIHKVVVPLP